jgi:hypothetical protein
MVHSSSAQRSHKGGKQTYSRKNRHTNCRHRRGLDNQGLGRSLACRLVYTTSCSSHGCIKIIINNRCSNKQVRLGFSLVTISIAGRVSGSELGRPFLMALYGIGGSTFAPVSKAMLSTAFYTALHGTMVVVCVPGHLGGNGTPQNLRTRAFHGPRSHRRPALGDSSGSVSTACRRALAS